MMKLVRCNKCNHEYYICKGLSKLSIPEKCDNCGASDYTVLEDDIRFAYRSIKDDISTQREDIRHSLLLFREELEELVKTYIEPFLK